MTQLADLLGAALATTLMGQGMFQGHPRSIGVVGTVGHVVADDVMNASDCVVTLGAGLNRHTAGSGTLFVGRRVIQVDDDPTAFGRSGHADIELTGDVAQVVGLLVDRLTEAEWEPSTGFTDLPAALAAYEPLASLEVPDEGGFVDMRRAVTILNDVLPPCAECDGLWPIPAAGVPPP